MRCRPLPLVAALLLSLGLHLLVLGEGALPWLDEWQQDEVLSREWPQQVLRVRLAEEPAPSAAKLLPALQAGKLRPAPPPKVSATAPPAPSPLNFPPPPQPAVDGSLPARAMEPNSASPQPSPEKALAAEPAPAFPVQLSALLEGRLSTTPLRLQQTWTMEGRRYAILVESRRFGLRGHLRSEGHILPSGGLSPERSYLIRGTSPHSMTEYRDGWIRFGPPSAPQQHPLPVIPQDLASITFHLATTFTGQAQTIFISTGHSVIQTRFSLVAEETLRLPGGTLRTLHLAGEHFDPSLRAMVKSMDIWLAPGLFNYPVKVAGHLSNGMPIEYRVHTLEMEGRPVFGIQTTARAPALLAPAPLEPEEATPSRGLNKP